MPCTLFSLLMLILFASISYYARSCGFEDKYTVGKVAFTMKGYQEIVPDMTEEETAFILEQLKLAREQAVDYKSMKQISAIFKAYKTKIELYFYEHGRNWRQMYKDYAEKRKAEKAKEGK